jgi:hypothetical protein
LALLLQQVVVVGAINLARVRHNLVVLEVERLGTTPHKRLALLVKAIPAALILLPT